MTEIASPATDATSGVLRSALGWSFLNNMLGRLGSALVGILLARILAPADYGVYAVCLVVLAALLSLNELGVSLAVVRWPGDVQRIAPTVMTLALTSSSVLYVVCFALAPTVADALHAPQATNILRLLATAVLIDAVTAVPVGLMTRDFLQRRRLVIDSVALVTVSSVSIALAVQGYGPWSLAWGNLMGNLVSAILITAWAPLRIRPGFDRAVARDLLSFGLPLAGASVLAFAMLNIDYVVVGAVLGPVALGFYLLAFNLSSWPVNLVSAPVRRVAVPAFARLRDTGQESGLAFVRASVLLLAATIPAVLLLALLAHPLVQLVYGGKWLPAADVLPLLAALALARVLSELTYDFLVAHARSRSNLVVQAAWVSVLGPAIWVGAHLGGLRGVAVAHVSVALLVAVPTSVWALRRAGVRLAPALGPVGRLCLATSAAALTVLLVTRELPGALPQLLVSGIAGSLVYAAVAFPVRRVLTDLRPAPDRFGTGAGPSAHVQTLLSP